MKMKVSFSLAASKSGKKNVLATNVDGALLDDKSEQAAPSSVHVEGVELGEDGHFDWLAMARDTKRRRLEVANSVKISEESFAKLKELGEKLACDAKYGEAIDCFEQALCLQPQTAELHEMIAQAYLELDQPLDAISSAELAVRLRPNWFIAKQTLGRAQLNLGEIQLSLKSFCRAAHLAPFDRELVKEDMNATWLLLKKAREIENRQKKEGPPSSSSVSNNNKDKDDNEDIHSSSKYFNEASIVVPEGYTLLRVNTTAKEK